MFESDSVSSEDQDNRDGVTETWQQKKQLCEGYLAKIDSVFPCLIDCLPLFQVYYGDDLQENDQNSFYHKHQRIFFWSCKKYNCGYDIWHPPPVEYGVKNACLLFCFVSAFLLQKAEMQRLFTVKTLPKTNFPQTMSSASNFSRATNQTTSLYVENNF